MKLRWLDGVPVRDVPPDWVGRTYPARDEPAPVIVVWWARHPNGKLTPVYDKAVKRG